MSLRKLLSLFCENVGEKEWLDRKVYTSIVDTVVSAALHNTVSTPTVQCYDKRDTGNAIVNT